MWNPDKAATVATRVLVEYLGVSAEFVVGDAIAMSKHTNKDGHLDPDQAELRSFLINLGSLLPSGLPTDRIRESILKHYLAE